MKAKALHRLCQAYDMRNTSDDTSHTFKFRY